MTSLNLTSPNTIFVITINRNVSQLLHNATSSQKYLFKREKKSDMAKRATENNVTITIKLELKNLNVDGDVFYAQLEHKLEQERRQRSEQEKGRRRVESDTWSSQQSLGEMEKSWSGLEELIKRSAANCCHQEVKVKYGIFNVFFFFTFWHIHKTVPEFLPSSPEKWM